MILLTFPLQLLQRLDDGFLNPLGHIAVGEIFPQVFGSQCHLIPCSFFSAIMEKLLVYGIQLLRLFFWLEKRTLPNSYPPIHYLVFPL